MSVLAVSVQFYGLPRIMGRIPSGAFFPRPDVDSAIVRIDVYDTPQVNVSDVSWFFRVVKAGFSQRRKQLQNALASGLGIGRDRVTAALLNSGIDPKRRAQTLALEEWGLVQEQLSAEVHDQQDG
jgi:16S rRNA (adenine1518-N6/adenine1519-N6)-dimethyltransferase